MKERDKTFMWVMYAIAAAALIGVFLLSAVGALSQEAPLNTSRAVHVPTAGVLAPVERITLGRHYQLGDVSDMVKVKDGSRVLMWFAEQHYCVPLTPDIAGYLDDRRDALGLVGIASGETTTGIYLAFIVDGGKYGEAWLVHEPANGIPFNVACLAAVMVYAPNT